MAEDRFPLLDRRAEIFEISASNVILRHDESLLQFRGSGVARLLLALDGSTAVKYLCSVHGTSPVEYVLDRLRRAGLVVLSERPDRHLAGSSANLLRDMNHPETGEHLHVVVTESYFRPELRAAMQTAERNETPWILLKSGISKVWLSPVFDAQPSPCWKCFLRRLASQDDLWALLAKCRYRPRISMVMDLLAPEAEAEAARHIQDYLAGELSPLRRGALLEVDITKVGARAHAVVPYPACECYSRRKRSSRKPWAAAPEGLWETVVERVGELIDPTTGVVAELGVRDGGSDAPLHVSVARYADPTMGKLSEFTLEKSTGRVIRECAVSRNAFGSAESASSARARAILEAFERYCGISQPDDASLCAAFRELGDAALHPNCLMNYSAEQLEHPNWAAETPRELRIPAPFDEDAKIHWTAVEPLSGSVRYVPTAFCFDGFDTHPDASFCTYDTNGSAIAFTIDDAIVHGFLELVERDATGIWWYNRIARPIVRLATFGDSFIDRVVAQHAALDRDLNVYDITHDLGISIFAAVSLHRDGPLFGFGGHFDSRQALRAALREVSQTLCFARQEARKWYGVDWTEQPHLEPCRTALENHREARDYHQDEDRPTVQRCVDAAAAAGLELLVKDCSRAEIDLRAVRVMVPGLRHVWPRFGPGRLWDVPVRLGWLKKPTAPGEWNPEYLRS